MKALQAEFWNVTNAAYHQDPAVGASMLKVALRSPAEYHGKFVAKTIIDKPTRAKTLGSVVHCKALTPNEYDDLFYTRPEGINGRTTEGKKQLADLALQSVGKTEVTPDILEQAQRMVAALEAEQLFVEMRAMATIERGIRFIDSVTGTECKAKPDLDIERPDQPCDLILDLKTDKDPTPETWAFQDNNGLWRIKPFGPVRKYLYDLQLAHYQSARMAVIAKPCNVGIIVVGSSEPHDCYFYDLTDCLPIGHSLRRKALDVVFRGTMNDVWRRPEQGCVISLSPGLYDEPDTDDEEEDS